MLKQFINRFLSTKQPEVVPGQKQPLSGKDNLLESDLFQSFLKEEKKPTLLLKPHLATKEPALTSSKMGGLPNLRYFKTYPTCNHCNTALHFVFQLYKEEVPQFYFPEATDLFQLFRCPNDQCTGLDYEKSDLVMYHFYHHTEQLPLSTDLVPPAHNNDQIESPLRPCQFLPLPTNDYPHYEETNSSIYEVLVHHYEPDVEDFFMNKYSPKIGTKVKGYPSWTQSPYYPKCTCGKTKSFLFQFASEEIEDLVDTPTQEEASPHGVMIGDMGNIYYFYCEDCGEQSLESYWDCY